jgi:hypothetical protein
MKPYESASPVGAIPNNDTYDAALSIHPFSFPLPSETGILLTPGVAVIFDAAIPDVVTVAYCVFPTAKMIDPDGAFIVVLTVVPVIA